jgi:outer membrane immunogenic protein
MQMSLRFAAALVAVSAMIGTSEGSAADIETTPYSKTPFSVPTYDWSGAYVGINLGYGMGRSSDTSSLGISGLALFTDTVRSNMFGIVGGGQIGVNAQIQSWLVGLEGDFQGTGQRGTHSFTCPAGVCTSTLLFGFFPVPGPAVPVTMRQQLDFFGTIRGRFGVVVLPQVLLYTTAGMAYGQVDSNTSLTGAFKAQNYNPGWTAGGGIEAAIGAGWSTRLEYLYLDLGRVSGTFASNILAANATNLLIGSFSSRITDNIVRIGLNYRFFGEPIITHY